MMTDEVRWLLNQEETEFHERVLTWSKRRLEHSARANTQRGPAFDQAEELYRSFRDPDETDDEVASQPMTLGTRKIVVPMTYATIQSMLAWQIGFFTDRKPLIPVEGNGPRDVKKAIVHELLFEHQYDQMLPRGVLCWLQWFLDAYRYGIGVVMNAWTLREFLGFVRRAAPLMFGSEIIGWDDEVGEEELVGYEGNQIVNINPRDWYRDPRVPVGRFQEGEFCGYMTRQPRSHCRVKEREGLYAGVRFVENDRDDSRGLGLWLGGSESRLGPSLGVENDDVHGWIDEDGKPFLRLHHLYALLPDKILRLARYRNPSGLPRVWVVTLGNLSRVLRVEPANLPSRKPFPMSVIEPNFDLHSPMNPGIVETVAPLNHHLSWLVNSRVANVRRSMNFEIIYDPSLIEQEDIENPKASGLIRLKPDAYNSDVDLNKAVRPFPVADVTAGHMADMRVWADLIEQVSGANRMIQGLSNTGRRAATEVQASLSLASGRMKLLALIMALQGVTELCEFQLANTQTFLGERLQLRVPEHYRAILGQDFIQVTPDMLSGSFRIPLLEQGIPTDKTFHANVLREVLGMGMQSQVVQATLARQINYSEIFFDLMRLIGKKNLRDYVYDPQQQMAMAMQQQHMMQMVPGAIQVRPDEEVAREVERGNLVPDAGAGAEQGGEAPGAGGELGAF